MKARKGSEEYTICNSPDGTVSGSNTHPKFVQGFFTESQANETMALLRHNFLNYKVKKVLQGEI